MSILQNPRQELSPSSLMRAYNAAVRLHQFDELRLNRAFGILQSSRVALLPDGTIDITNEEHTDFYLIKVDFQRRVVGGCDCLDRTKNHTNWCKHRIAAALIAKAYELELNP